MNKNSRNRLRQAQKAAKTGQKISVFPRPAPYQSITLSLCKTQPVDNYPKVARKGRSNNYSE